MTANAFLRVVLSQVCLFIIQSRSRGSRLNIIIVAEGAIDRQGQHISSDFVKDVSRALFQTEAEGNRKLDQLVEAIKSSEFITERERAAVFHLYSQMLATF